MSDFDREAERERLRERFEAEDEKRAATEQMSELLLQGATMTNAHCSECGNPVFRYDGQEFCATCQRAIEREGADDAEEDASNVEVAAPSADERVRFGAADEEAADDSPPADDDAHHPSDAARQHDDAAARAPSRGTDVDATGPQAHASAAPSASEPGNPIERARADLAATLARFARAARDSDSPQAATANLEAALAAAETLDELD